MEPFIAEIIPFRVLDNTISDLADMDRSESASLDYEFLSSDTIYYDDMMLG